ncbi:4668_t:CDS:1 [Scutellospora calospora]|uniref:4668_t:CDS:1 n=1 Tax=Scutellospora calospora TaxID=85575 RepID=A0ACA9NA69_9GLOM|nr:4668_t:CDS:1 [Scutellospora calospora]
MSFQEPDRFFTISVDSESEDSKNADQAQSLASMLGRETGIDLKILTVAAFKVIKAVGVLFVLPLETYSLDKYTNYILEVAKKLEKKHHTIYLNKNDKENVDQCLKWMKDNNITDLYLTGPREEDSPGIYERSKKFFVLFFEKLKEQNKES